MGSRIAALARADPSFRLAGVIDRSGVLSLIDDAHTQHTDNTLQNKPLSRATRRGVVIDFSSDDGARAALSSALARSDALLIGTTALGAHTLQLLKEASKKISILVAPNTSLGIAVLSRAASDAARALGPGYSASIVEAHHSRKKDAPSGTAIRLASVIRDAGNPLRDDQVLSIRAGDIIGEHTIRFAGPGECIELTHRATSRDVFALGALRAAAWIALKPAGWWTMEDVVGLPRSPSAIE